MATGYAKKFAEGQSVFGSTQVQFKGKYGVSDGGGASLGEMPKRPTT